MKTYPDYEFYVVRYDINKRDVEMWNIFQNWLVGEHVFKDCKKYLRNKKELSFEELKEKIRRTIMWQEWSRVEYEISVGDPFPRDMDKLKKIDAYYQALPNMELITKMCIEKTKEFLKEKKNENITEYHVEN